MKKKILGFCGFKPIKTTSIGSVKNLNEKKCSEVLEQVKQLGHLGL